MIDRRLVAVMFTDMVGYTALMQSDERAGLDKRDRYMSALENHHDTFGGTIVQRLGDGSMSMFPSSLDAVLAAVAIQQELAANDVRVRIGVHVGEVIVEPSMSVKTNVTVPDGCTATNESSAASNCRTSRNLPSTTPESLWFAVRSRVSRDEACE